MVLEALFWCKIFMKRWKQFRARIFVGAGQMLTSGCWPVAADRWLLTERSGSISWRCRMMEKFKSPPCSANVRGELPEVHYPGCIAPVASSVMFGLCSLIFKSPETAIKINLSKGVRLSKGNFRQLCLNLCLELPALKDSWFLLD